MAYFFLVIYAGLSAINFSFHATFTVNSTNHYPALTVGYTGAGNLPAEIRFLFRSNTNWIYSHSTAGTATSPTNQGMRAYIQGHSLLLSGFYFTD